MQEYIVLCVTRKCTKRTMRGVIVRINCVHPIALIVVLRWMVKKMPSKKYALKGEPDFHNLSDDRVKSFLDLAQQMIFTYKGHDDEKVKVLQDIWKELSLEHTSRLASMPEVVKAPAPVLGKAPKLRKSPAKRKI